jgi:hypothetical protein
MPVLASIAEGFALVRREPRLVGALLVTLLFNLFGWPFTSMIPGDRAGSARPRPEGIGMLASMDGVGAFLGAVTIALLAQPAHYKAIYVGGITLYFAMLAFALATDPVWPGSRCC